ncbi:cobyrinic acid a,c-diamide synthase [Novimethylophilus kurashikiensis]|uniref:Cobyrinic acid a,c-diamide synthase n=2 Tax=Novimethylophilus kurashikiensis TaxID=1825523 RepID=A0A2R5F6Z0_9PROT|nr:cobyrinic acid a,c-diamide synthase [Novimethylophilus kurashikiensis]
MTSRCPALFISAPASHQGKTTITAGLARLYRRNGKKVRVFKTGPDFLDPMILQQASGAPVYQLDLWMGGEAHCRELLALAAQESDVILVEGVMGLFDGQPSSADLASLFGIPVLAVVDGSAMAQTFGAIAYGLANYRAGLPFAGVLANRVGGEYHAKLLADSLPQGMMFYGAVPPENDFELPHRHLGLWQAEEIQDLDQRLEKCADALARTQLNTIPEAVDFDALTPSALPQALKGVRIAVARDAAFAFIYQANLDILQAMGAELRFFSPLADRQLPEADSLYLPGGYPELHLAHLQQNTGMKEAIRAHHAAGKPTLAECGGMLYLLQSLTTHDGEQGQLVGLLPGQAVMQKHLTALALQKVVLPEGELRGHTYHHSRLESPLPAIARGECPNSGKTAEGIFRDRCLTASYVHFYFPSNPQAVARLFQP